MSMKTAAIIAEYNPFHNGHLYQIEQTRKMTGADYIIIIMSGSFVQRGAPALCSKYLRTEMAVKCGADVVIELPVFYALSSAELFAQGAVSILNSLGVIDYISFGSECGDISLLQKAAALLLNEPDSFKLLLLQYLKSGLSFPSARLKALRCILDPALFDQINQALSSPNNILGIEYCKSLLKLNSSILPITIKRNGAGYHDLRLQTYSSASAIRLALESAVSTDSIASYVPKPIYSLLSQHDILLHPSATDDFSSLLHYRLITESDNGFDSYLDCSKDFSDKLIKSLEYYTNLTDFSFRLKSKDLTHTRINRMLFHILLGIKKEHSELSASIQHAPYARLLGFNKNASALISSMNKNSSIPVIMKPANAKKTLSQSALTFLKQDIQASHIYESIAAPKQTRSSLNDYRQPLIIHESVDTT